MARRTGGRRRGHVCSGQRKPGDAVIERRRGPAGCRMASGTICRGKSGAGSGVHGIIGLLPSGQMALRVPAIGRGNRQIVVVIEVAQIAGHVGMPAGQQETGRAVVECCRRPTDRRMAGRAVCSRKSRTSRRMDRIIGLLPRRQMAAGISAIGRSDS
jgi:hypothetical protein